MAASKARSAEKQAPKQLAGQRSRWLNLAAITAQFLTATDTAIEATKGRARLPFGWTALDLAWKLVQKQPIRLLDPHLAGKRVPTVIAGIARQLQLLQGAEPILLPIDHLRGLLEQRKVVVSGAVQRLVDARLLDYADKTYHTGKAREFRFLGIEGEHFEKVEVHGK